MKTSEIHVRLDGVPLTDKQLKELTANIEQVVSEHLARVDLKGDVLTTRPAILHHDWLGIWIRKGGYVDAPITDLKASLQSLH